VHIKIEIYNSEVNIRSQMQFSKAHSKTTETYDVLSLRSLSDAQTRQNKIYRQL